MKALIFLLISVSLAAGEVAPTDAGVGTWRLDPKASKYAGGAVPKAMLIRIQATGGGVHYQSETTLASGKVSAAEYQAKFDGVPVLVRTDSGLTAPVSMERLDERTVKATYTRYKETVATSTRTVSKDGQRMTIVTMSKDKAGKMVTNTAVFTRVDAK